MKKKEAIDSILDNFDFERVHKAMTALNWTWITTKGVPEIPDLRQKARELLKDVSKRKSGTTVGTGGFEASKEDGVLQLEFVLYSWDQEYTKKRK